MDRGRGIGTGRDKCIQGNGGGGWAGEVEGSVTGLKGEEQGKDGREGSREGEATEGERGRSICRGRG